ncbi:hypothetical protein J2Z17_001301 [Rhizobium halophytocola]|uniref:Uncharacterized protein n=1 Tax=Rhizobium halophytocola TaxID=735519 RepID=A0ABS4DW27_9HYPH|nr:hypothetical protein [Rhizobium halophytocola]
MAMTARLPGAAEAMRNAHAFHDYIALHIEAGFG